MPVQTTAVRRLRLPTGRPRQHALLRDAALGLAAAAAVAATYQLASGSPAVATGAVLTISTGAGMHARLAMGRTRAAAQIVLGAALLALVGAPPRLIGAVFLSGLVGAELVAHDTRRTAVLQAGAWTGLVGAVTSLSGLAAAVALPERLVLSEALGALAGGVLSAPVLLTFGPAAEWLFGHTTRLTFSEWLSYDHPLLRELVARAPGTFQHSVNVGVLSDAAARAIGGDALLARVGGLYHDVGKMRAPEFFAENQRGANPHDRLDPRESAHILRAHVTDGVALVAAHRMGDRIADFVREHHGTGTMRLLLEKAAEADPTGAPADEEAFRYPGPRPRSRETGITMIADQLEATARAAPPAGESGCFDLVNRTVDRILGEGELEDSGLTPGDLSLLRPALARALLAMYHRRLTYPPSGAQPPRQRLRFVPRMLGRTGP